MKPSAQLARARPGPPAIPRESLFLRAAFAVYRRALSPLLHAVSPSRCVFLPTCSEYAHVAIARFGWLRGGGLALRRLLRCHPWAAPAFDPVPPSPAQPSSASQSATPS